MPFTPRPIPEPLVWQQSAAKMQRVTLKQLSQQTLQATINQVFLLPAKDYQWKSTSILLVQW